MNYSFKKAISDFMESGTLEERISDLENTVSDLRDELDLAKQEHQNELSDLRAKVEAMENYRQEQVELAIVERDIEILTGRLAAAERRRSVLSL